jgi:hypothetical protein
MIRAACHIHSDWSYDGKWPLERLAAEFRARKYRVLLMTEHDRGFSVSRLKQYREACAAASGPDLLVIPGLEYSDAQNCVHVLVWGAVPFLGENLPTLELLEKVKRHDGIAVFAHPSRKAAWKLFEPRWSAGLLGIEIWNRKTDGWAASPNADRLLKSSGLMPFAGLDFHSPRQFFPLAMVFPALTTVSEHEVLRQLRTRQSHGTSFGRPLPVATSGWIGRTLTSAEKLRRRMAATYRMLRKPARRRAPVA